jgi:uncharacterized membrane protein
MLKPARLSAIDMLRGLVIALMALDHTRDFFGPAPFNAEDLSATTPAWFWTRWITHLCATVFVLLAGSSAFLRGQGSGIADLSRYLATRGLMLVALEATWISFSWQFGYNILILQVIWALGVGMLILALLVWLPRPAIALIGALLILPHNALDGIESGSVLWKLWHQGGFVRFPAGFPLAGMAVMYPLMPWVGLICVGYALGPVFLWERMRRERFLLASAAVLLLAFVALRWTNLYGDPEPWSAQDRGVMLDIMSFVRVHKYPPSLLYLCITAGIGLLLLALLGRLRDMQVLLLFGRNPLLFYVIHIALIHFLGNLYFDVRYGGAPDFSDGSGVFPAGYAPSLAVVYGAWLAILALMLGLIYLLKHAGSKVAKPFAKGGLMHP